jgi:hypothetical protein
MPTSVLTFSEVCWDFIEGREPLGGATFHIAAHLSCCGAREYCCTTVGHDDRRCAPAALDTYSWRVRL